MNNQEKLEKYYQSIGYTYLGYLNTNLKAQEAYQKSKNKQWHEVGHNLHLVALHDKKMFVIIDSGD